MSEFEGKVTIEGKGEGKIPMPGYRSWGNNNWFIGFVAAVIIAILIYVMFLLIKPISILTEEGDFDHGRALAVAIIIAAIVWIFIVAVRWGK
uniref:Membrane protein n=1 Tax=Pithovirus LCDPAC02 TaxID=2506601 RepID=A0A481YP05_9VIRU|nr:MAG: membrane protein [Pithovirus LCDPAC02]